MAVVYGVYLLEQRHVWSPDSADGTGLADPPQDSAAFDALRQRLASSARIAALL